MKSNFYLLSLVAWLLIGINFGWNTLTRVIVILNAVVVLIAVGRRIYDAKGGRS